MSSLNFDKFTHEANDYINELSSELGHPDEQEKVLTLWRAVMHTIRDRISHAESFNLISQLPTVMKGLYTENWKYTEKPPLRYKTIDEMADEVEKEQANYGESRFSWDESTAKLISIVLNSMQRYISEGELEDIKAQFPQELKEVV